MSTGKRKESSGLGGGPRRTGFLHRPGVSLTHSRGFGRDRLRGSWNKRSARGKKSDFSTGRNLGMFVTLLWVLPLTFHRVGAKSRKPSPAWAPCRGAAVPASPPCPFWVQRPRGQGSQRPLRCLCLVLLELSLSASTIIAFPKTLFLFSLFIYLSGNQRSNPSNLTPCDRESLSHSLCLPSCL